jgi:uncharacterized protein YlaI
MHLVETKNCEDMPERKKNLKQGTIDSYYKPTHSVNLQKKKYNCIECGETVIGICMKLYHESVCTKKKCFVCNKIFGNLTNYTKHLRNCPPKRYTCKNCSKTYSRSTDRNNHEKKHLLDPKKIVCGKCNCIFLMEHLLRQHEITCHVEMQTM